MIVRLFTRAEWLEHYATDAHFSVFGEKSICLMGQSFFDAAAIVIDEDTKEPIIYSTIKQLSEESVFLEFGGSFPQFRGSMKVLRAFKLLVKKLQDAGSVNIGFSTKHDNVSMQKLGLSSGFIPVGFQTTKSGVFIEYALNFKEGDNLCNQT